MNRGVGSSPGGFWRDADAFERCRAPLDSFDGGVLQRYSGGQFGSIDGQVLETTGYSWIESRGDSRVESEPDAGTTLTFTFTFTFRAQGERDG